jgi:hypothetical protein
MKQENRWTWLPCSEIAGLQDDSIRRRKVYISHLWRRLCRARQHKQDEKKQAGKSSSIRQRMITPIIWTKEELNALARILLETDSGSSQFDRASSA